MRQTGLQGQECVHAARRDHQCGANINLLHSVAASAGEGGGGGCQMLREKLEGGGVALP